MMEDSNAPVSPDTGSPQVSDLAFSSAMPSALNAAQFEVPLPPLEAPHSSAFQQLIDAGVPRDTTMRELYEAWRESRFGDEQ